MYRIGDQVKVRVAKPHGMLSYHARLTVRLAPQVWAVEYLDGRRGTAHEKNIYR